MVIHPVLHPSIPVRHSFLLQASETERNMKRRQQIFFLIVILILFFNTAFAQTDTSIPKLENPFTVSYVKSHLRKTSPRLFLTPSVKSKLKNDLNISLLVKTYYRTLQSNANYILKQPLLKRVLTGKRLLPVAREILYRMSTLGLIYQMENDPVILKRINDELIAVCNFSDWHPSHPLDDAEFSLAVAIGVDWTGKALPKSTRDLAVKSLIEKGINASFKGNKGPYWLSWTNNWNQVCSAGFIAASIVIADKDPALAAKTISTCLDGMPNALHQYAPDGAYPEGPVYWGYGSSFTAIASSVLKSAFGKDFGIAAYPALLQSANYRLLTISPSGMNYDYGDCRAELTDSIDITYLALAWFAQETGNALYLNKDYFLKTIKPMRKVPRIAAIALIWLSEFEEKDKSKLPLNWEGRGPNPIVVFRGAKDDPHHFYLAAKGGKPNESHGSIDQGSFIFELNGVRWVIDPGTQVYNDIEKTGFDLWRYCQHCQRWTLLSKNNFGHSTITVNDSLFNVNGKVDISTFDTGRSPHASFDMTPVFKKYLKKETRTFTKESDHCISITDDFVLTDSTKSFTWAIMTTADVVPTEHGAVLKKDGKQLFLRIVSPQNVQISVISLNPPPLKIDSWIDNLKRVELRVPEYLFNKTGTIKVRFSSENDQDIK
jgi:hypothetical protein